MKERVKFVLEWEKRWNEGEGLMDRSNPYGVLAGAFRACS